ncbi:MAG: SsrA-binding protein SmpB [Ardenticatenaceae bacterium]|nr:SsrA-binding protein SmpB [Ardenticatenaceae bacterium]HBY94997.1 SsrA-binding protein [Chloroflexota bacterium]
MAEKVIAVNRKARHDYFIEDTYEAGIVLTGTEIKSIRAGNVNLRDSYVAIRDGEAWVQGMHVSPYRHASTHDQAPDPLRPRKLLLHRNEIGRLAGKVAEKGLTIVPLRLYLKDGRAKLEIGVARGKKLYDKRQTLAERDAARQIERALRSRGRDEW